MSELWFEKYRPRVIDDITISPYKLKIIEEWFTGFHNRTVNKKALLFTGPPGLGKTSLAHIILKHYGYTIKEFNASDIRSQMLVNRNMYQLICIKDVTNSDSEIGIIMDEVDGMSTGDRGGIEELLKFIQENKPRKTRKNTKKKVSKHSEKTNVWGPPIICICNTGNIKANVISNLRKKCVEIPFTEPSITEIETLAYKIMSAEGMKTTNDALNQIVKFAQFDYRRLIGLLQHIYVLYSNNGKHTITEQDVFDTYDVFCQKEQDLHIKDNIKRMINKQLTYSEIMNIYHRDKSKTPMVLYQNYLNAVTTQKAPVYARIDNAINIANSLVDSDIIEKAIYNTQGWHLQPIQGLTCAYIPSYHINNKPKIHTVETRWTDVLTTNSHTQSSKKKMQEILQLMKKSNSYDMNDIQFLSEIIVHLLTNNRINEAIQMLDNYELSHVDKIADKLASVIKMGECSNSWKEMTTSERSRIDERIKNSKPPDVIETRTKLPKVSTPITLSLSAPVKISIKPKIKIVASTHSTHSTKILPKDVSISGLKSVRKKIVISAKNPKRRLIINKKT